MIHTKIIISAVVDLELSAGGASQNLLDISSVSSPLNDFHGNNETLAGQQTQNVAAVSSKKEGNLLSWFTSSSASTSALNNATPPAIAPRKVNEHESELMNYDQQQQQQEDGSSSPSLKISNKLSYGEKLISKFNKNGNKATTSEQHAPPPPHEQVTSSGVSKEQQQKSSRRTTSLLNLFMSNSHGNHNQHKYTHSLHFFKLISHFNKRFLPIQSNRKGCDAVILLVIGKSPNWDF